MRTEASFIWRPDCSRRPDGRPNFHILVAVGIGSTIWSPGVIWSPIWSPECLVVDLVVVDAVTFGNFWFQVKCVFRNLSVTPNLRRKSWQIILGWPNQSKVFCIIGQTWYFRRCSSCSASIHCAMQIMYSRRSRAVESGSTWKRTP